MSLPDATPATLVLADATVRVTLLLLLAWCVARFARNASARIRHAIWATALVGALLVPPLAGAMPGLPLAWLPQLAGADPSPTAPAVDAEALREPEALPESARAGSLATRPLPDRRPAIGADRPANAAAPSSPRRRIPAGALVSVWAAGFLLALARLGRGLVRLARLSARSPELRAGEPSRATAELARGLGLRRRVAVKHSREVRAPLTWGWLGPEVLLPDGCRSWSAERLRIVLLHELAHVREQHWPLLVAARVVAAAYWFHPLVWLAVRRLRVEREQACDELVVEEGTRPSVYATHLLDLARGLSGNPAASLAGVSMIQRCQLERRLAMILRRRRPAAVTAISLTLTLAGMGGLVAAVSAVEPAPPPPPARPAEPPPPPVPEPPPPAPAEEPPAPPERPTPVAPAFSGAPQPAAPATRSTAPTRGTASQRSTFRGFSGTIDEHDGFYYRSGYENGDLVLDRDDGKLRFQLRIEDPDTVEFGPDGRSIVRMGRHASVLLRTWSGDARQRLEITADDGGGLRYDWVVDGRERDYDADARRWTALALEMARSFREAAELVGRESSMRGQISSLHGQRSSLRGEISSVRGQLSSLRGKISSINGQVSSMRGEISSIRGRESSLRGEISSLRGQISSLRSGRYRGSGGTASDGSRLDYAGAEMNAAIADEIAGLETRIRGVETKIAEYDAAGRVREVEAAIDDYDADARIREVEREIAALDVDGRVREIEAEIAALDVDGRVAEIEREIDATGGRARAERIEAEASPLWDELARLSAELN